MERGSKADMSRVPALMSSTAKEILAVSGGVLSGTYRDTGTASLEELMKFRTPPPAP